MNELQTTGSEMGVRDFLGVLRRRIWVILPIMVVCLGAAYYITQKTPKMYRAEAQMMLVQRVPGTGGTGDAPQTVQSMETQVSMIESHEMASRVLFVLKNDALRKGVSSENVPFTTDMIEGNIKVTNPIDSNLLVVTADADSPVDAQALARSVNSAFITWKKTLATNDITNQISSLTAKVEKAHQKMNAAQAKETQFKQAHHLADVAAEESAAIQQFENSDNTVIALNQELASQSARVKELDTRLAAATTAVTGTNGVPDEGQVIALNATLNQLEAQLADAKSKYRPDYPGVFSNLNAQIASTKAQLNRALRATTNNAAPSLGARSAIAAADSDAHVQLAAIQSRLAAALQSQQTLQNEVNGQPTIQMEYARLTKSMDLATDLYTQLQAALNAANLEGDRTSGDILVIQQPDLPSLPFKPNLKTNLLVGFAVGALLSFCLVMLLEQLDQRVHSLDEVRALVSGPIVGMLPLTSRSRMTLASQGRLLPEFEEALSLVRVNLSYVLRPTMGMEQVPHQTILVTSTVRGEGKSVAASQLARNLAQSGKSVILVDANLRRPVQNILFQTGETRGLADVLDGQIALDEAITTSDVEGLSILHSGISSQNPTVLLSSPRLASLMEALRYKADVVIVDAPDCSSVADTLLLTAHADCLLQVVRAGLVDLDTLHNASLALHATGKKVAVFANGLSRPQQRVFKSRFAYAALTSAAEPTSLPQSFEKTMVMNRPRDLVFSKSVHKSLEIAPDTSPQVEDVSSQNISSQNGV